MQIYEPMGTIFIQTTKYSEINKSSTGQKQEEGLWFISLRPEAVLGASHLKRSLFSSDFRGSAVIEEKDKATFS